MTPERKHQIASEAIEASREGRTPLEACPYPFASDEGRHWVAVWTLTYNFKGGQSEDRKEA